LSAILVWLATSLIALLVGAQTLHLLGLRLADRASHTGDGASHGDSALQAGAALMLGYAIIGLGALVLGLLGYANWWALAELLLGLAFVGVLSLNQCIATLIALARTAWRGLRSSPYAPAYRVVTIIVIAQALAALAPAGPTDYDGISQHLVHGQQYLMAGKITPLWYDHHSQFPATVQMLYMIAQAFGEPGAAKLFHWGFGVLALLATLIAGRRLLGAGAGAYGALILATTPSFAWLMGVAYVDLATTAGGILALMLLCLWLRDRDTTHLWLSALMIGAAATTKMQALALLGVLTVAVVIGASGGGLRRIKLAAAYAGIALALCMPWYAKSWVWTGNPVYPLAYSVFDGKMWCEDRAEAYTRSQLEFGKGELPPGQELAAMSPLRRTFTGPRAPANLLLAPLHLLTEPVEFTVGPSVFGAFAFASPRPLYLALIPLLLLLKPPRPVGWMILVFAPLGLWWLMSMQLARYLLPSLALLAPAAGWAAAEAERRGGLLRPAVKLTVGLWAALAMVMMAIYVYPQVAPALGLQSPEEYLTASLDVYPVSHYVAEHTPPDAKVALYGEPRGYYLQRAHIWGEPGHSALIDYASMSGPEDLIAEYRRLGITHVLVRTTLFPDMFTSDDKLARRLGDALNAGLLEIIWDAPGRERGYLLMAMTPAPAP